MLHSGQLRTKFQFSLLKRIQGKILPRKSECAQKCGHHRKSCNRDDKNPPGQKLVALRPGCRLRRAEYICRRIASPSFQTATNRITIEESRQKNSRNSGTPQCQECRCMLTRFLRWKDKGLCNIIRQAEKLC